MATSTANQEYTIRLHTPHPEQQRIINSAAKRKIVRAGRRSGKTETASIIAVKSFLAGLRPLYATPTAEQLDAFWFLTVKSLYAPIQARILIKNEVEHTITLPGTKNRIKAKTAWNADTLRGDFTDLLLLDEWQLMNESTWGEVGAPMLMDNNGDAIFFYTPPSLIAAGVTKARDPRHASKMYRQALEDTTGLWQAFHFTSMDNPHISQEGLAIVTRDMSLDSYRREILAEDDEIEAGWLVYQKFNERVCVVDPFPIPKNWLIYSGHDFGSANPAALFLAQNPGTGDFFIYKEYSPGSGYSTAQHVENFESITKGYNVIVSVGGNRTTEDEIRQGYGSHGWIIIAPRKKEVKLQIDRTIGHMELNKIKIFKNCTNTLAQISSCMWKLDDEGHVTNDIDNEKKYHLLACLRYIASDFRPDTVRSGNRESKHSMSI